MQELISAKFALDNLYLKPNTVFLDATFHLPNSGRNALDEFNYQHIPNAQFFDIDKISDKKSSLPHMLPDEVYFSKMASSLGVKNDDAVVVYDNSIFFSSARAWWMFKIFGHNNIRIIDGGLKAWLNCGGPSSNEKSQPKETTYIANKKNIMLYDTLGNIMSDINSDKNKIIIDARGEDRFFAKVKEPRAGIKSGHIPSSLNIPISSIIDKNTNCLKSVDEIKVVFSRLGLTNKNSELVMTCGSGVTACGLALAANSLGFKNVKVYDGSWSEWGSREETPVEI
jgi:thiosulfate/3-mercaptopyruvate sulfurtransferase